MAAKVGFYPVILLPQVVRQFGVDYPIPAIKPLTVNSPLPSAPIKPVLPKFWVIGVVVVALVAFGTATAAHLMVVTSVFSFGCSLLSAAIVVFSFCRYWQAQQQQVLRKYQVAFAAYQQRVVEITARSSTDITAAQIMEHEDLLIQRVEKLAKLMGDKVSPLAEGQAASVQKGVSEAAFYSVLQAHFKGIRQGGELLIPGTHKFYSADFSWKFELAGLAFDIEVDEPYVGKTGEPHHAVDDPKDSLRNQLFLDSNWIVVRFSERQVVEQPLSCVKVIAILISTLTGLTGHLRKFESVPDLTPHNQWTVKEAKQLAKSKYRDTYLKLVPNKSIS